MSSLRALYRVPYWYFTDRDGNLELYTVQADGTHPTNLTRNSSADGLNLFSNKRNWMNGSNERILR
jgi:hypothetical protein